MTNIVEMNVLASVFIIIVVLVRSIFICKLPKRCFTILWIIASLRLIIPFSYQMDLCDTQSQQISDNHTDNTTENYSEQYLQYYIKSQKVLNEVNNIFISSDLFNAIRIIGTTAAFSSFVVFHFYSKKNYSDALPYEFNNKVINEIVLKDTLKRKLTIKTSDKISTPFTSGIIRPVIYIPKSMLKEKNKYTQFVFYHELIHIHSFDILYKWIIICAACLNWFNPMAWIMFVLADNDTEYACDESVLKKYPQSKKEYAEALIAFEEHRSNTYISNYFSRNIAEKRIYVIINSMKIRFSGIIAAIFISFGTMNLFITCSDSSFTQGKADTQKNNNYKKKDSSFIMVSDTINQLPLYITDLMDQTSIKQFATMHKTLQKNQSGNHHSSL